MRDCACSPAGSFFFFYSVYGVIAPDFNRGRCVYRNVYITPRFEMAQGGPSRQVELSRIREGPTNTSFILTDTTKGVYTKIENATNVQLNGKMTVYMGPSNCHTKRKIKNKKPVTVSSDPVTTEQMLDIKDYLGKDWRDLGRRLGFEDTELEQLHLNYKDELGELNYQILYRWKQSQPEKAIKANLAKTFMQLSRGDLADMLSD